MFFFAFDFLLFDIDRPGAADFLPDVLWSSRSSLSWHQLREGLLSEYRGRSSPCLSFFPLGIPMVCQS